MAESILKLRVDSTEYNSKLQRASQGLQQYADQCRKAGGTLESVEKDTLDFVKALGKMETTSKTVRGSLGEMTKVFTEMKMQYKQLTDAEKSAPYGKALAQSLDQLKGRINQAQSDLKSINQELQGGSGKFGQFGSVIDGLGQKMGVNANLTELLTSKTALMTGAIGASTTVVVAATKAWADYNSEIGKQQQITTVTTGLKGDDADKMTSAARALSKTYGVDFREAINAANTIMTQFGKSGDEATQLLRDGMQGMIMGDGPKLLSMIQQYAPAFRDAGVSASQLVAVIQNSEGGIFTAENTNAIVMGIKNIRLMTKQTGDALAQIGIDGKEVTKALNDGTMTIFDALKLVAGQLKDVDSNSQAAGQVMQAVFGRQGAMAGTNLAKAIEGLNTNLAETKRQTGEVGQAYDELYQANVRLEQALQKTFGYKGWEEMATGIKTKLVSAMANVLELTNKINAAFNNTFGVSFFEGIYNASTRALGPLGTILRLLKDINKEKDGASNGGNGSSRNEDFEYIKSGATKQEREDRYSKVLSDINKNLAEIGKEKTRTNKDGSTSFYIDSPAEQQRQRQQLLDQRTLLVMNRDTLMAGNPSKTSYTFEPFTPTTTTKTKGSHTATKPEQAQAKFDQAERDYQQALAQAAMELRSGTITEADAKKKELQAKESLWKSIGDAREIYDSPKLEEAQRNVENEIIYFGGVVKAAADAQKSQEKAARELEAAQKKLADAKQKLADARATGSATAIYKAQQEVDKQQKVVQQKMTVKVVPEVEKSAFENLKQTIEAEIKFDQMKVDETTLKTLLTTAIQNGLNQVTVDYAGLQEKIAQGIDIPESTWKELQDEINAKLKEIGVDKILNIDFSTGSNKQGNTTLNGNDIAKQVASQMGQVTNGISSMVSGIQNLGVEIPEGLAETIAALQAMSGILSAILTITTIIQGTQAAKSTSDVLGGIIKTVGTVVAMRNGGVAHAANGMVAGNDFSDKTPVMVSSGELILNKAQQGAIAQSLQDGSDRGGYTPSHISGEQIWIALNRYTKRTGRGEMVTWK